MSQTIASLMHREVWSVDMDDTIERVDRLLADKKLSWAPVLENGTTVVGAISATDLLQFHMQGRDAKSVRAWQLCSYKPIRAEQSTPAREVARLMVERHIHHVIVTHGEGIAGVVSSLDFVRTFSDAP